MKSSKLIDKLARVGANPGVIVRKGDLTIVGGIVKEKEIGEFLQQTGFSGMTFCTWEWDHRIVLGEYTGIPGELEYLERGRIFGDGGDLSMRRDGECFLWNYVGPPGTSIRWEETGYTFYDFWSENPEVCLYRWDNKEALLWGVYENGIRTESRVGFNNLHYPSVVAERRRVVIKYREYMDAGRSAFVWWYGLEGRDD